MGFNITSKNIKEMYRGQIITYVVHPFKFISTNWVTEITHVKYKLYFVDEQRFGPYSMWHHEHLFKETDNGIEMTDRISYKPPFGFLGSLVEPMLIRPQLFKIFKYRHQTLNQLFNS